ncbi:hypothetical protein FOBRF1_008536 [Fusarium oxysporum]
MVTHQLGSPNPLFPYAWLRFAPLHIQWTEGAGLVEDISNCSNTIWPSSNIVLWHVMMLRGCTTTSNIVDSTGTFLPIRRLACTPPDMNTTTPHTQRPECSAVAAAVDRSILNPGEP